MKIINWKANGSSKFEGKNIYYYKATLDDGRVLDIEKTADGKFQLGIGNSKSRRENAYDSAIEAIRSGEKVVKKQVSMSMIYDDTRKVAIVHSNGKRYEYGPNVETKDAMTQTDFNRIDKIVNGDSPYRAWIELKKFSLV